MGIVSVDQVILRHLLLAILSYALIEHLLVGFVALRPKSTAMVMAGWSVNLTTLFPGQA